MAVGAGALPLRRCRGLHRRIHPGSGGSAGSGPRSVCGASGPHGRRRCAGSKASKVGRGTLRQGRVPGRQGPDGFVEFKGLGDTGVYTDVERRELRGMKLVNPMFSQMLRPSPFDARRRQRFQGLRVAVAAPPSPSARDGSLPSVLSWLQWRRVGVGWGRSRCWVEWLWFCASGDGPRSRSGLPNFAGEASSAEGLPPRGGAGCPLRRQSPLGGSGQVWLFGNGTRITRTAGLWLVTGSLGRHVVLGVPRRAWAVTVESWANGE